MSRSRTPTPVIDCLGRIVAVLANQPEDSTYSDELMNAYDLMETRGQAYRIGSSTSQPQKRGHFSAYNCGTTMGMGSCFPVFMNPRAKRPLIQELLDAKSFQRMASYQSRMSILVLEYIIRTNSVTGAFQLWAPRVYAEYEHFNGVLRQKMRIRPNFAGSIFLGAAFNFGLNVWTYKHRDQLNWAFGWCAITALGRFNARHSAQLILWELKLVIDFPHTETILLSSAVITHSNTVVHPDDRCNSFTQFSAGAIFRWVENGCRTEAKSAEEDLDGYEATVAAEATAIDCRIAMFSTVDELCALVD
jgi:hypothetical protein